MGNFVLLARISQVSSFLLVSFYFLEFNHRQKVGGLLTFLFCIKSYHAYHPYNRERTQSAFAIRILAIPRKTSLRIELLMVRQVVMAGGRVSPVLVTSGMVRSVFMTGRMAILIDSCRFIKVASFPAFLKLIQSHPCKSVVNSTFLSQKVFPLNWLITPLLFCISIPLLMYSSNFLQRVFCSRFSNRLAYSRSGIVVMLLLYVFGCWMQVHENYLCRLIISFPHLVTNISASIIVK